MKEISLIVIPNQRVFEGPEKKPSVLQGFKIIDDILRQGVQGISDIITKTGVVNRDFNDVNQLIRFGRAKDFIMTETSKKYTTVRAAAETKKLCSDFG